MFFIISKALIVRSKPVLIETLGHQPNLFSLLVSDYHRNAEDKSPLWFDELN
jgi:hypothetical protein